MKYSFDEKLKVMKLHLKNGSYLYPEGCDTKDKKKTCFEPVNNQGRGRRQKAVFPPAQDRREDSMNQDIDIKSATE